MLCFLIDLIVYQGRCHKGDSSKRTATNDGESQTEFKDQRRTSKEFIARKEKKLESLSVVLIFSLISAKRKI